MKIGITGGAGFIGANLVERLSMEGHQVFVLDNFDTGRNSNLEEFEVDILRGDAKDIRDLNSFFQNNKLEVCFHLAAMGSVPRSIIDSQGSFESNTIASFNIAEIARKYGVKIIFTSSSSVYGSNSKLPKSEVDWLSPISPYAAYKAASEAIFQSYSKTYGLDISIFRLFNVYGPKQNPNSSYSAVIPKWIKSALTGVPLQIYGDGEQKRDFTFVQDVVAVFISLLENIKNDSYPINLAFGKSISLNNLLKIFENYFGKLHVEYLPVRNGDILNSQSDPKRFTSIYPEINETPIEIGLIKTFDWYKTNKDIFKFEKN